MNLEEVFVCFIMVSITILLIFFLYLKQILIAEEVGAVIFAIPY